MIKRYLRKIIFFVAFFLCSNVIAQVLVSNLAEYQVGNLPEAEPANLTTFYNQLNLDYFRNNLIVGMRFESFQSSVPDKKYSNFTQRYLEWQKNGFMLRIGNYYGMLGRGLVFRAFELPGVVREDARNRIRYGLSRDLDGFMAEVTTSMLHVRLLRGEALDSTLPPSVDAKDRSLGIVEGGQLMFRPVHWLALGGTYARYNLTNSSEFEAGSGIVEWSLSPLMKKIEVSDVYLDFYGEFAQKQANKSNFLSTSDRHPHALYFSTNFIWGRFGLSAEHKDYHDFRFQVNDPPPLVREHSYYLLNRETHVLLPEDEKGNQFEATYTFSDGSTLIANYTHAENRFSFGKYDMEEVFFEMNFNLNQNILVKAFVDKGKDEYPAKSVADRKTAGIGMDWQFLNFNSINFDLQIQETEKTFDFSPGENRYKDYYWSLGFARSPKLSMAIVGQRTGDPIETDDVSTSEVEITPKNLWSFNLNYQVTDEHEVFLFYGKRRGGFACTAGTCYEVLPFQGFEVRLQSRL